MSMTRLVVLANSWKHADWCLAGIDLDTGDWVRPVSELEDGRIPRSAMQLEGYFPKLLDVIELPLAPTGPDYGFEKENRTLLSGKWKRHESVRLEDLKKYAKDPESLLHGPGISIPEDDLRKKPMEERHSLQLLYCNAFRVRQAKKRTTGEPTWQGLVVLGGRDLAIRITDPVFVGKLNAGHVPAPACMLTISLSMPYKPPEWAPDRSAACWKLIAGVVEVLSA